MSVALRFTLNGTLREVRDLDPHTTLLQYLRQQGHTGTKEGCAEGECGACAVVVVERDAQGNTQVEAINACLLLLPTLHDSQVWTVEGVGRPEALHPVQAALVQQAGSQCGYCTPGFVMSMFAHYYRVPRGDVDDALAGNLCRCTGYRPIRAAARALPQVSVDDPFLAEWSKVASPAPLQDLTYHAEGVSFARPASLAEALRLRAEQPDAQVIAGGTDLVVEVNQTRQRHARFLSLSALSELRDWSIDGDTLVLGSGLTWHEITQQLSGRIPMLDQLIPLFASRLIRARATLGGNLMTASPVGDAAPVLLALDAELELISLRGRRRVALEQFFVAYRKTALADDELLLNVRVPLARPSLSQFYKVSKRVLDDISCVSAGLALTFEAGVIRKARLAFGGVADRPMRAYAAEAVLVGSRWDAEAVARAQPLLRDAFTPLSDARGSAAYRLALVQSLLEKFFAAGVP